MLAFTLLSIHNITELVRFTERIRAAILADRFTQEFAPWLGAQTTSQDAVSNSHFGKKLFNGQE
jgi:queuine tRNA-ribosyltransferase